MIHDVEEKVEYGKSKASEKEKEDKVRHFRSFWPDNPRIEGS